MPGVWFPVLVMVVSDGSLVLLAIGRLRVTMSNIIHVYPYGSIVDMLQAIDIGLGFGRFCMSLCGYCSFVIQCPCTTKIVLSGTLCQ